MAKHTGIIMLYDLTTGTERELCRMDGRIEAPFFLDPETLCYNQNGLIYRMKIDECIPTVIPTGICNRCNNDHVPAKDGKTLAVSHNGSPDGSSRIYLIDLIGNAPARLITPNAPSYLHGYSPDGKTLAYCAERNGNYDLYTISVDGGEERRLTDAPGLDDGPEYSPDGRYLYFNSVRCGTME